MEYLLEYSKLEYISKTAQVVGVNMIYILIATIVLIGIANYLDSKNGHSK